MVEVLKGKPVVDAMAERISAQAEGLRAKGAPPKICCLRVGARPDDLSYERTVLKRADALGLESVVRELDADATEFEVAAAIEDINADSSIHGCLMFRPLPKGMNEQRLCNLLAPEKDIDAICDAVLGSVFLGTSEGFVPATAQACIEVLDFYGIDLSGKHVVVVGRSNVIGKPVAMLCLARNASVTICHSKTTDLPAMMRAGDVVICATGRAKAYGSECFRPGQTVIDVGINFDTDGNMCGDVDFDAVVDVVDAITPVPGGLGSVTTSVTLEHVVRAAAACVPEGMI
jgi:methylenetetrahydrofolate dehydrogenase (NADP+)/methenyltetrahydrofolate cyclohydrolase